MLFNHVHRLHFMHLEDGTGRVNKVRTIIFCSNEKSIIEVKKKTKSKEEVNVVKSKLSN